MLCTFMWGDSCMQVCPQPSKTEINQWSFFFPFFFFRSIIRLCGTDCLTVNSLTACWRSENKHEWFMSVQNLASDEAFVYAEVLHRHGQNAVCWVLWSDDVSKIPHYLSTCRIPADFKKTESWETKNKMSNTQRFQMHAFCSAVICISVYFFDSGETNLSRHSDQCWTTGRLNVQHCQQFYF